MSKIMLIDDDESLRELVGQIAAREGWDYCCSDNGAASRCCVANGPTCSSLTSCFRT